MVDARLIYRIFMKRPLSIFVMTIMSIISFYMISNELMESISNKVYTQRIHNMFSINESRVGLIKMTDDVESGNIDIKKVKQDFEKSEYIKGIGFNSSDYIYEGINAEVYFIDESMLASYNISVENELKENMLKDTEYIPVVVGYNLRNKFNIGDTIDSTIGNKYRVYGYLAKDDAMYHESDLFGGWTNSDLYNLDDSFVAIVDNVEDFSFFNWYYINFYVDEGDYNLAKEEILKIAESDNINIQVINRGEEILEAQEDNSILHSPNLYILIVVLLVNIITITIMTITYVMIEKRQYGILSICTYSRRKISFLIIKQNAIIVYLAAIIAWAINQKLYNGSIIIKLADYPSNLPYKITLYSTMIILPLVLFLIASLIIVISSMIPVILINRYKIPELIHSNN
ncbi:ABC transporter permease family protein [Lachnospira pectinoschiza]|uniref:FtsX-like permease family n=1 Tax=Lachnospira pectinoschiza TaxID=28052 RepID=A0A1G9Z7C4_9FIRM|nr:hypothetical protein [Lachnospira pectinoschiza]SDN16446.1 hypothetical protein SAMN05216544_2032 [Lachnospira pectinoschiza]